jgi:hypothetical protein
LPSQERVRPLPPPQGWYELLVRNRSVSGVWSTSVLIKPQPYVWPKKLQGRQITASENHPGWRSRKKGRFSGDVGGPFRTELKYFTSKCVQCLLKTSQYNDSGRQTGDAYQRTFLLPIDPNLSVVSYPIKAESSDSLLMALGSEAIAKVKPTNSYADVATALGEILKDGIPDLVGSTLFWRDKASVARKKVGGEYLNVEFGWKPLLNDIGKVAIAVKEFDRILSQYIRDSGRIVRRKYEFPTEVTESTTLVLENTRPWMPAFSGRTELPGPFTGKVFRTDKVTKRRWFSGAFTYHIPRDIYSELNVAGYARRLDRVFGLSITPDTLWNLAPWSWLVDWHTNAGSIISNLTDFASDGLVLKYGYIMEHTLCERTYTYEGPLPFVGGSPVVSDFTLTVEVKKRLKATPFGFGLTWEGFSPRQLAILAALGISRGSAR